MTESSLYKIIRNFFDGITPKRLDGVIRTWIADDKQKEEKNAAMKAAWNAIDVNEDVHTEEALARFKANRSRYNVNSLHPKKNKVVLKWAAAIMLPLIGLASGFLVATSNLNKGMKLTEMYVPEGQIDSIMLSDGTKVVLNGGTTFYYPTQFSKLADCRNVYLVGEGHFDVSQNKRHPFIVHSGDLNIQVLGTHFNVKAYAGEPTVTTTLEEGAVRVYDGRYSMQMKPNEQVVYHRQNGKMEKSVVQVSDFNYWISGNIVFDHATLNEILTRIGNCYDVKFVVDSHVNLNREYTVSFTSRENIRDVMDVLSELSPDFDYKMNNKIIKLYSSRKEVNN